MTRRNTRVLPIFATLQTPAALANDDNVPIIGRITRFGALWTTLAGTGPGGVGFGAPTFAPDNADAVAPSATNSDLLAITRATLFNGANWDRQRSASAANISAAPAFGNALVALAGNWSQTSTPGAAAQATTTRALQAGARHVCTSIAFALAGIAAQPNIIVNLRDGASGAGTILWSMQVGPLVIGTSTQIFLSGLSIFGTAGTAMTLEFAGAPAAGNFESVAMTGYTTG